MTELIVMEKELMETLGAYIAAEETRLENLKRMLSCPVETLVSEDSIEELERHISNPFKAYKLVRGLRKKWKLVEEITTNSSSQDFLGVLKQKSQGLPSDGDVDGVALGLVRLQETYHLHPESVMKGGVPGLVGTGALDPDEMFHIATVAHQNWKYQYAFLWMQETLRQLDEGVESEVSKMEVLRILAPLSFQMGVLPVALNLTQQILEQDSSDLLTLAQFAHYKSLKESVLTPNGYKNPFDLSIMHNMSYEALCRGEGSKMTDKRRRRLFCRYSSGGGNARLIYAPVKEEDEWDHPRIIRYHELMSDKEIEIIKTLARPKLARAKVVDHSTGNKYSTEFRVSKSAWLAEDEDPVVVHVTQRVADVTGLDMASAEILQVANYGIGGQYEPHFDSKLTGDTEFELKGGRIATVLIYMSDVEIGGATVFPAIGAALKPQKGSAVVWFNLLQNGEEDANTLHAACPVFVGNKWVANKWIRAHGQEFRRRCSLSHTE
ncbi:prolyl 4-hydroxylase subunit alpha-2 isoform X2 [Denticeps clupeoides]|nr:prolyl 4-hydroxylase subunit alpha-2-like isoform X2 [Denticeps clupeoides]